MEKHLTRHLAKGANPTPERDDGKGANSPTKTNKGGGKGGGNLRAMSDVKPEARAPPLFYCKPVNDKGGPCHADDWDDRSRCLLQLKRQQHTKDGKTVTHQDHFRCTNTCGYCGKRHHYEDECHMISTNARRLKARKPKHPPELPRMGTRVLKEEARGGAKVETPTPRGARQRPLLFLLLMLLSPRNAHRGVTPPLGGLNPRRGDWHEWPSCSWLLGWM